VAGSSVFGYGGGHDADGTGSRDEDVFSEDGKGKSGVHGVAEGIEDGGDLARDAGAVDPDVGHGKDDELGKGAVTVDADSEGVGAEMAATGEAVATAAADDVAFAADELADGDVGNVGAYSDDLAYELVADGKALLDRGASPGVPLVDVKVGTADAGGEDTNFDVVDAHLGFGDVLEPETAFFTNFY
jgi:hypothetical protein